MPWTAKFGLGQHERLRSSSENVYRIALERMFRSRLIYRMEEVLEANRNTPGYLYEALKVYIMLGGLQPLDRELVIAWMRRDWADNLYPGAGNAAGRKALEDHLVAMLDLEAGQEPLITLHGPLIEETQKTLARLSVAQRAYELLKSQARCIATGGLDARAPAAGRTSRWCSALRAGRTSSPCASDAFFTYAGFRRAFVDRLGDIAEQVKRERWVLGPAGEQAAVSAQYDAARAGPARSLRARLHRGLARRIGELQLRPLTTDKPKYIALGAAAAATSPIKQLLESIRDETALTRERPGFDKPAAAGAKPADTAPALLKQQGQAPGAAIEAAFKAFHVLVEGDATRRPIDAIIANLNEIHQSLTLLATNPSQAALANAALQTQVASLRANANRLPAPFADLMLKAAGSFEGDLTSSSHRAIVARARRSGHRRLPADRAEPLSVRARQRAGRSARGFRPAVRPRRRARPLLHPEPHRAGRHARSANGPGGRTTRSPARSRRRRCANSSAPRRFATPSSRPAATCRRSPSP